jgi:hypothetical protein
MPDAVPLKIGATMVLLERFSVPVRVAIVPDADGSVSVTAAPTVNVVVKAPVNARLPANTTVPGVVVKPVPPELIVRARSANPVGFCMSAKPASIAANSARIADERPLAPVAGTVV